MMKALSNYGHDEAQTRVVHLLSTYSTSINKFATNPQQIEAMEFEA